MSKPKRPNSFAVIGLGSFGRSIADELIAMDKDVLIIDNRETRINDIMDKSQNAVICDSTDKKALIEAGLKNIDHAIVCIGDGQASILTTLILTELGVRDITVKVSDENQRKIVEKLRVDRVDNPDEKIEVRAILPEHAMGKRIAREIANGLGHFIKLTDDQAFSEVNLPDSFIGSTVYELDVQNKHRINIVAVRRDNNTYLPAELGPFQAGDRLNVIGKEEDITKFNDKQK